MSSLLFGVRFRDKADTQCFSTGVARYVGKDFIILEINNEGYEFKIKRSKIEQIRLLKKGGK